MNKSSIKLKRLHRELVQLEVEQADVKENIRQVELEMALEKVSPLQKTKKLKKTSSPKKPKKLITSFFKKDPVREARAITLEIINKAWDVIVAKFGLNHEESKENRQLLSSNREEVKESGSPKQVKVKNIYSNRVKDQARKYLTDHSISVTYLHYNRKIPKSTLYSWKQSLNNAAPKGKQGRHTLLRVLEEEMFLWFLSKRARKLTVSQANLVKKALKKSKEILVDPELALTEAEKQAYTSFSASNGWVQKFKDRYKIVRRFITTKCTKTIEEMKPIIEAYFSELNDTLDTLKPKYIYNMDEVLSLLLLFILEGTYLF